MRKNPKLRPLHPGRILSDDYMLPLKLSRLKLAQALHLSAAHVGEIVDGKRPITPQTAMRLGRFFNTTADFWVNLQAHYDLEIAEDRDRQTIDRAIVPYAMAVRGRVR